MLGIAELESLLGADHIVPFGGMFALSDIAAEEVPFEKLGGSIKLCTVLKSESTKDWRILEKSLLKLVPERASSLSAGKLHLGLSTYSLNVGLKDVEATALRLKKAVRSKTDQTVRVVPNKEHALSTAQILHNKLVSDQGMEIVLVQHGDSVIVAQTIHEQDITAYANRDQNRPKRDARVGMLPPKLAQIIVNLAASTSSPSPDASSSGIAGKNHVVLDPFCGTGVILQEAALMGYDVYGTDLEERMVDFSAENLRWLNETHELALLEATLQVGDATNYRWPDTFNFVACEGYLGQPFTGFPTETKLREVTHTCNQIAKGFLKNLASQIPSGTRICFAVPAWKRPNDTFVHLKLLDQIEELGYNRVSFVHVRQEDLLYYRPDQVVARELLVITRK
jgi:tRNA G10  N-methylase Trm11